LAHVKADRPALSDRPACQIGQPPQSKRLVRPHSIVLIALLVDDLDRWPKVERRALEIDRPPVAGDDVGVVARPREGGGEEPDRAALFEICDRVAYLRDGQ